jgi:hypothetical protein
VCQQVYRRFSFVSTTTLANFRAQIVGGIEEFTAPPLQQVVEKPPNSFIQKLYVDLVKIIVDDLGEAMPHEHDTHPHIKGLERGRVYIPSGLASNVLDLTRMLLERGFLPADTGTGTLEYLAWTVFPIHFWHVKIKKWIPFARCDKCVTFFNDILSCKTVEKRAEFKQARGFHIDCCTLFRRRHELRIELGKAFPDLVCSLVLDAMDNAKTQLPRLEGTLHAKKLDNIGQWASCELLAVLVHGFGFYGGWILPHLQCNAAASLTVMLRVFRLILEHKGQLPPVLLIQADNSGKDNKNKFTMAFLGWLVENKYFLETRMYFLVVGHTHCIIDQHFSVVHRRIRGYNLLTPEEAMTHVGTLFEKDGVRKHELVTETADFYDFFEGKVPKFKGLGTSRKKNEFQGRSIHCIRVTSRDTDGKAVFQFKEFDTNAEEWQGHWSTQAPLPIFLDGAGFGNPLLCHPRIPVPNLDEVKLKWKAVMDMTSAVQDAVNVEGTAVMDLAKDLTRARLDTGAKFWDEYFSTQEEFWEDRDPDGPRESHRLNQNPLSFVSAELRHANGDVYPNHAHRQVQAARYIEACKLMDLLDRTNTPMLDDGRLPVVESTDTLPAEDVVKLLKDCTESIIEYEGKVGAALAAKHSAPALQITLGNI